MWFWPSNIGKEAFLLMCIGAASFGLVRLFAGHLSGLILGGLGIWGTIVVRPHVALVFLAGLVFAAFPESHSSSDGAETRRRRPVLALVLPLLALALIPLVASSAETFFGIEDLNLDTANEVRDDVGTKTGRGDSEFTAPDTGTLPGMLVGVATVIGRPLPWETNGGTSVLAAIETAALVAILAVAVLHRRMALVRSPASTMAPLRVGLRAHLRLGLLRGEQLRDPGPPALADASRSCSCSAASARRSDRVGDETGSMKDAPVTSGRETAAVSDA